MTTTQEPETITDATLATIADSTLANGGETISLTGKGRPGAGWLVALPTNENIVATELFDVGALRVYVDKYGDDLSVPDNYLGTWVDDGKVYIDTSVLVQSEQDATRIGRDYGQLAIYNIATGETLTLGSLA